MSEAWPEVVLEEACEVTIGRQRSPKKAVGPHMCLYMRAANAKDGRLDLDSVLEMNFTPEEQAVYALRPGDVLVTEGCGSIKELGASTAWAAELPGVVCFQNTLLRLRARDGITFPGWLAKWARWAHASGLWAQTASGTNIFHIGALRARKVALRLPPLDQQRRIADLLAGVDDCIRAAERRRTAEDISMKAALGTAYDAFDGPAKPLDSVLSYVIGGAWGDPPGVADTDVIALGPIAFAGDSLIIDPAGGTRRSLSATRAEKRSLREFDIILERSGGTDEQPVGRVIQAPTNMPKVVPSDFMRLLRVDPSSADPRYIFWVLWLRYHRGDTVSFQSKTTNIRNLRVPDYLGSPIRVPEAQRQSQFVALAEAFARERGACDAHLAQVRTLRSALLEDLFSGNHEIPDAYDELLSA